MIYHSLTKRSVCKNLIRLSSLLLIWTWNPDASRSFVLAQIIPDKSLEGEKSVVVPNQIINGMDNGMEADLIQGGARRKGNLFHSFQDFNVKPERGAYFNNPDGVQNILGRVTGNKMSEILGTLGVYGGNANLFLLNPNGILFGKDSSLDVGGSFLATTADSIVFDHGFEFAATNTEAPPLLTISTPLGLQFGSTPGKIVNRSKVGINSFGLPTGLEVQQNQTMGLVGGDLSLEAGNITAEGRIELGAVSSNSFVGIQPQELGWKFNYDGVNKFADINLSEGSNISNNSVEQVGGIAVQGKNIDINGGSYIQFVNSGSLNSGELTLSASESITLDESLGIFTYILGDEITPAHHIKITTPILLLKNGSEISSFASFSSEAPAGDIVIQDSELVELMAETQIRSLGFVGNGGNVNVNTKKLSLQDGGRILSSNSDGASGQAGTININAQESVKAIGGTSSRSGLFARSETNATGDAGTIIINTPELLVQDSAEISTATLNNTGRGGNIIIENSELVRITGVSTDKSRNSRLTVTTEEGSPAGGNVKINTNRLLIEDGGQILASTFGGGEGGSIEIISSELVEVVGSSGNFFSVINSGGIVNRATGENPTGNAGDLTITTKQLNLREGGQIAVSTFGEGKGGTLTVTASNIELTGQSVLDNGTNAASFIRARTLGSGQAGDLNITTETLTLKDGADIAVSSTASGDSGNLNIFASDILISENAAINVSATGTGQAGSLKIEAQDVTLDRGSLTAETRTGDQGNITIDNADTLLLRNNSQITTNATELATGGNITITSKGIALVGNSNITARAEDGRGGNIQINTQRLFREPDSEIDASSDRNIDGIITINSPNVDPTSGLFKLPDTPIDAEAILAQDLCKFEDEKIAKGSSFIITGRGGLTPTSEEPLGNLDRVVRWANRDDLKVSKNGLVGVRQRRETTQTTARKIQQSQGWVTTVDGSVWLVANPPETIPQNTGIVHPDCRTLPQ